MYGTYMYLNPTPPQAIKEETTVSQSPAASALTAAPAEAILDSSAMQAKYGSFASASSGTAQDVVIENKNLKITLSSKGGKLKEVVLKNYKTYDAFNTGKDEPMVIIDEKNSDLKLEVTTPTGVVNLNDLYFTSSAVSAESVTFTLPLGEGKNITQKYSIAAEGFAVDYDLNFEGTTGLVNNSPVALTWVNDLKQLENDLSENRKAAQINYYQADGDFEDVGLNSVKNDDDSSDEPVQWFSFKQKYFTSGFISKKDPLDDLQVQLNTPEKDSTIVKEAIVKASLPMSDVMGGNGQYKMYFGPNDLNELKATAEGFNKNLYLGYDLVKPVNRFIFVPMFNWLEQFFSNYGLLIIVVVLLIKLTLTPLLYKSYVSSAKMRIMAPEIAEIKEKIGDDQVAVQQETMKLYQQVGVSPLSGCVPMLLQMPILMSVFFLFPNMEMFRQKSFLWAKDLSTYDAPISWATSLPFIGNHLSLFVVLMTISSLAFTYYNNQITPDQPGPIDMKKISYVFPLVFFFVLNSFPAALSFYYLVSNLVTIAQQLTVKRFVNEDKIKTILDENRKNYGTKPKKKNKFSDYLQKQLQAQEELNKQKAQDLKKKKNK